MTKPSKGGRPKKYDPNEISPDQQSLIDAVYAETNNKLTAPSGDTVIVDSIELTEEMILSGLKSLALRGNVKAYELLGEKFGLFDNKEKNTLLDIFAPEGTLEENIERYLDVLEDKYLMVDVTSVLENSTKAILTDESGRSHDEQSSKGARGDAQSEEDPLEPSASYNTLDEEKIKILPPTNEDFPVGSLSFDTLIVQPEF